MTKFQVNIPDDEYQILEFRQDELPGVAVINLSLVNFEPKEVFSWHCSIMLNFKNPLENGMPRNDEVLKAEQFEDFLDDQIKGENKEKPNALFLSRITWNETREITWRVYDPKPVNDFLQNVIETKNYPFEFDFRIEADEKWSLADWHLNSVK